MGRGGDGVHLIIGIGNAWRGDDAAGLAVTQLLRRRGVGSGRVRVEDEVRDGAALMERWSGTSRVWLIDAAHSGAANYGAARCGAAEHGAAPEAPPPGTIRRIDAGRTALPRDLALASSHRFGVLEAVETARRLGRLPADIILFAIEGSEFSLGCEMSPAVRSAVEILAESIIMEIATEEA